MLELFIKHQPTPEKFDLKIITKKPGKIDRKAIKDKRPEIYRTITDLQLWPLIEYPTRLDIEVTYNNNPWLLIELKTYIDKTMYSRYVAARMYNILQSFVQNKDVYILLISGQRAGAQFLAENEFVLNSKNRSSKNHFDCDNYNPLIEKKLFIKLFTYLEKLFDSKYKNELDQPTSFLKKWATKLKLL